MDIDCRGGLAITAGFSEKLGYKKFNLLENSDSSEIYGQFLAKDNTSYLAGYYARGEKARSAPAASFVFFGDLMLDRDTRALIKDKGIDWPTEKIQRLFWSQDYNIANLEGTITENNSVSVGSREDERRHFSFTFDPKTAQNFLLNNKINIVSLANNHSLDFGPSGLMETKKHLEDIGIAYLGDSLRKENYLILEKNGTRIALVAYNQFQKSSEDEARENVRKVRLKSDVVILMPHWGTEYSLVANQSQAKLARRFIDAGADLIVGSHPHVTQNVEVYKNKAIFYSLGNFIFDQYFSEEVKSRLALGVVYEGSGFTFYLIPLYLEKNGQLSIMEDKRRRQFLERIARDSDANQIIKNGIIAGEFRLK